MMRPIWRDRSGRERAWIARIAAVAGLAVLAAVWLQAERTRERLELELPRLRGSIAALERDAEEVRRLRALPAATPGATAPLAALATNAGGVPGAQIVVIDERRVRLTGADIAFGALLEWLGSARATHGMRVEAARLESLAPGRVRAELTLARS
ncbi:MAG: type II secretion system protein GspM [Usitatibacter sp.]